MGAFGPPGLGPGFYPPGLAGGAGGGGGSGDVVGPASAVNNNIVLFDGTTGKLIKDSGASIASLSGAFSDWKSIGTGGDYADVQAMLDDSQYKGYLLSDVTEDSNITPDANGLYLHLNGNTLTMGANKIVPSTNCAITIMGWNPNVDEVDYTGTVANEEFIDTGANTGCMIIANSFKFDNNSSASGCHFSTGTSLHRLNNLIVENPNVANVGVRLTNYSSITNSTFVSPGTTNTNAIYVQTGSYADNINMNGGGSWSTSNDVITIGGYGRVTNLTGTTLKIALTGNKAALIGYNQIVGTTNIDIDDDECYLSDIYIPVGTVTMNNVNECSIDNSEIATLSITGTSSEIRVSNTKITNDMSTMGLRCLFSNCRTAGITLPSGDNDNIFTNCLIEGNVSITGDRNRIEGWIGATRTLTLAAGAEYNNINVTIDQAVTDSSGNVTNPIEEIIY